MGAISSIKPWNNMDQITIPLVKKTHRLLKEFRHDLHPVVHGYANCRLHINLDSNGVPTQATLKRLEIDFPEALALSAAHGG